MTREYAEEMVLHRVCDHGFYDVPVANLWDARRNIAWCLQDNVGLTRLAATEIGDSLAMYHPLESHGFTWELVPR